METKINGELTQFEQLVNDANGNNLFTALNGRQYLLDHDGMQLYLMIRSLLIPSN